jgi:hypothetical protein
VAFTLSPGRLARRNGIGAVIEQQFHQRGVLELGRDVQRRRRSCFEHRVGVGPLLQERRRRRDVALADRVQQLIIQRRCLRVGVRADQQHE